MLWLCSQIKVTDDVRRARAARRFLDLFVFVELLFADDVHVFFMAAAACLGERLDDIGWGGDALRGVRDLLFFFQSFFADDVDVFFSDDVRRAARRFFDMFFFVDFLFADDVDVFFMAAAACLLACLGDDMGLGSALRIRGF